MKSPYYVGIVTSIYRKYIDLANSNKPYIVDEKDKEKLMQIFNRGGFSTGYLNGKLGKEMMYTKRPNHIGIKVGEVISYNKNKGYVKVKLSKDLELGDSIAIGDNSCKISELMQGNNNIKLMKKGQIATIGRIYGDIKPNAFVYKTVSISLNKEIESINNKENVKRKITGKVILKQGKQVELEATDIKTGIKVLSKSCSFVEEANKSGITRERIKEQLNKTGNTVFEFENIEIILDENCIIPISALNEIRRNALTELENKIVQSFSRKANFTFKEIEKTNNKNIDTKISLCINKFNKAINYFKFKDVDNIYLPIESFFQKENEEVIDKICKNFNIYAVLPAITKGVFLDIIKSKINSLNVKGFVLSNISQIELVKNKEIIANYTFNAFNNYTIEELKKLGFSKIIVSPELNKNNIKNLGNSLEKEMIVYGRTLLMTSEYCTIGTFKDCKGYCNDGKYLLKDRLGLKFPVYTNKINCNNLIYNSKITSIEWKDLNVNSIRIDILEETEAEIEEIIKLHINNQKFEGKDYTNGNLNKEI